MIVVIDYGTGNLHSVAKALDSLGEKVVISSNAEEIRKADKIVLPGVGSFEQGMKNLQQLDLIKVLEEEVLEKKKPFLGICLGMQLLAESGEECTKPRENGSCKGLGWIPFTVKKFNFSPETEPKLRIPHMGWDNLEFDQKHFFFQKTLPQAAFYFVHGYHLSASLEKKKEMDKMIIATCDYGYKFPAAIQHENILATQFHPEKSQREGLNLLKNFLAWNPTLQK